METIRAYHGTSVESAFKIARSLFVRSPLDQEKTYLESLRYPDLKRLAEIYGVDNLEDLALEKAASNFPERDVEHRVKCVSFSRYPFTSISEYDIFLGMDIFEYRVSGDIFFVPQRQYLINSLRELILTPVAESYESRLTAAFFRFNPKIKYLREK